MTKKERKKVTDENLFYEGMVNPETYKSNEYKAYIEGLEKKCKECKEKDKDNNGNNCYRCPV